MKALVGLCLLMSCANPAQAASSFLRFPDIHGERIVFSAGGDLWLSTTRGGKPRQLTSGPGTEYFAKFSPDGALIAYTGHHHGESQVYVVPVTGGEPRQLTHYPAISGWISGAVENRVVEWTPDGRHIVVSSHYYHPWAYAGVTEFLKIPLVGGLPERLPLFEGNTLSYSDDGESIVFTREARDFAAWKRYQGGQAQDVWTLGLDSGQLQRLTDWKGTDHQPVWRGNRVYFVSDRNGTLNLYRLDLETKALQELTQYRDLDIKFPGHDSESLVFERSGRLHVMRFDDEIVKPVAIDLDLTPASRALEVSADIEAVTPAPNGREVALTARGEIFLQPAKESGAAARNLSRTPAHRERDVAFSPDGRQVAFIADDTGQDELYVMSVSGGSRRALTRNSPYSLRRPQWSADGTRIAFHDFDHELAYVEVATGRRVTVARTGQGLINSYSWSPDSRFLAYAIARQAKYKQLMLFDTLTRTSELITDARFNHPEVAFDAAGRFIAFISERDFRPLEVRTRLEWNVYTGDADRVFLALTRAGAAAPFGAESATGERPASFSLDRQGLAQRVVPLPIRPGTLSDLHVAGDLVLYRRTTELSLVVPAEQWQGPRAALCAFALATQKESCIADDDVKIGTSAQSVVVQSKNGLALFSAAGGADGDLSHVHFSGVRLSLRVDPRTEWRQMFREAWRWQANNHHYRDAQGLRTALGQPIDWRGLLQRYEPLLDTLTDRHDLNYLLDEIAGELEIGHLGASGGDFAATPPSLSTGAIGADLKADASGLYRIERILTGENWTERTRSPLTAPGLKVRPGDYLLEINGQELRVPDDPYRLLGGTLDQPVTLKLASEPDDKDAWEIKIQPISGASENWLRYLAWVAENERRVAEATGGRVGYLHLPDCSADGLWSFARNWYRQTEKEGVIIDERANGGGLMAPVFLERVRRIAIGRNLGRTSDDNHTYPIAAFAGKTVMLADKYAGSDGDNLAYFYRKYGLGPVVGTRTWGGVIGGDRLKLVDGGIARTANQAVANLQGIPELENVGVQPDIAIDNLPHEFASGKDAQLERAIQTILERIGD